MVQRTLPQLRPEDRERWGLAADDLGPTSLPKLLFAENHAGNLEEKRDAVSASRASQGADMLSQLSEIRGAPSNYQRLPASKQTTQRFAQTAIPIPRILPIPPLFYEGGRRGSPPKGPGPQSRRRPDRQCWEEYARNLKSCGEHYPRARFPGLDLDPRGRHLCEAEAFRVYSDCRTGRQSKPFDPTLFYEE